MVTDQSVEELLAEYGWHYTVCEDYLATGWTSKDGTQYPLGITTNGSMVHLTAVLGLDRLFFDIKAATGLLELNAVLSWAKIGLDPEGGALTVAVDIPGAALDRKIFALAISCVTDATEMLVSAFPGLVDVSS